MDSQPALHRAPLLISMEADLASDPNRRECIYLQQTWSCGLFSRMSRPVLVLLQIRLWLQLQLQLQRWKLFFDCSTHLRLLLCGWGWADLVSSGNARDKLDLEISEGS